MKINLFENEPTQVGQVWRVAVARTCTLHPRQQQPMIVSGPNTLHLFRPLMTSFEGRRRFSKKSP